MHYRFPIMEWEVTFTQVIHLSLGPAIRSDRWRNDWTAYRTCRICTSYLSGRFRARICKRLWSPAIDSEESIQVAMYVAWRAGSTNRVVVPARQAGNRFLGSLTGLQIGALYELLCSLSRMHSYTSTPTFVPLPPSSCIDTSTEPYTDNYGVFLA